MKKFLWLAILGMFVVLAPPAHALFVNGGFQEGTFNGWTLEHGSNYGLTTGIENGVTVPVAETVSWLPGAWTDNDYYTGLQRTYITSGIDNDFIARALPVVKYGLYSALVNSPDYNYHASRIYQEDTLTVGDRDLADGRYHVRFAWAAVLEDPGHPPRAQPYFHVTLKKVADNTVLYSKFFYSNQPGYPWRTDSLNPNYYGWKWIDWQEIDLDITDNVAVGDTIRIELSVADCAYGGHGGYAFLDGFRSQASPAEGTSEGALGALGAGCGRVIDVGGKDGSGSGPWSGVALVTFFFALFLLPVWILKRIHGGKRVSSPLST